MSRMKTVVFRAMCDIWESFIYTLLFYSSFQVIFVIINDLMFNSYLCFFVNMFFLRMTLYLKYTKYKNFNNFLNFLLLISTFRLIAKKKLQM